MKYLNYHEDSLEIHRFLQAEELFKKKAFLCVWFLRLVIQVFDVNLGLGKWLGTDYVLLSGLRTFLSDCTRAEEPTEELGLELCFCGRRWSLVCSVGQAELRFYFPWTT